MRCHWNRKGCQLRPGCAGQLRQKTGCYQRKCKIFFCWTRKIQYQSVHPSNFKQFCRVASVRHRAESGPGAAEGGGRGQGLYNYRKGAIRVAGENANKKSVWCIEWWIFKFLYWKLPRDSTTVGRQCTFLVLRYFIPNGIEVQIVVIIRNVNIQKFYLFGNSNFKI